MGTNKMKQIALGIFGYAAIVLSTPAHALVIGKVVVPSAPSQDPNMQMEATAGCDNGLCGMQGSVSGLNEQVGGLLHLANVIAPDGKDPRQYVRRVGAFAPIGKITVRIEPGEKDFEAGKEKFRVSNVLAISPCIIKTTEHTIFGKDPNKPAHPKVIQASFGESANGGYKFNDIKATVIATGHREHGNDPSLDHTYLRLDKCVGEDPSIGWMEEATGEAAPGMTVFMAGISSDRDMERVSAQTCQIRGKSLSNGSTGIDLGGWFHDCASREVSSAAPLFRIVDGIPREVAWHVGSVVNVPGFISSYSPATAGVAGEPTIGNMDVSEKIEEDIRRFGRPNPQKALPKQIALIGSSGPYSL